VTARRADANRYEAIALGPERRIVLDGGFRNHEEVDDGA
jgi:hypothetical protein